MCKYACVEKVEHIFAKSWMISRRTQIWSNLVALLPDFINDNTFIHPKKYLYHDKINLIIILKGDRRSSPGQPCLRRGAELKSSTSKTAHRCQKSLHTFRWAEKILKNKHQRSQRLVVVKKFQAAVLQKEKRLNIMWNYLYLSKIQSHKGEAGIVSKIRKRVNTFLFTLWNASRKGGKFICSFHKTFKFLLKARKLKITNSKQWSNQHSVVGIDKNRR